MLLSVIIPVYKVEKYLRICIDSIIKQDYSDYEIILIDDGSPDKSGQICDEYADSFHNIRVIHQMNRGVSAARNRGLKYAKGKYICFIDADDYVYPGYFTYISSLLKNAKNDFDAIFFSPDTQLRESVLYSDLKALLRNRIYKRLLWLYVLRRQLIEEGALRFEEELPYSEDHCFLFEFLSLSKTIQVVYKCFYYYRSRSDSAIHKKLDHNAADSHLLCLIQISEFLLKNGILDNYYYNYLVNDSEFYFILLSKIPFSDLSLKHAKLSYKNYVQFMIEMKNKAGITVRENFILRHHNFFIFDFFYVLVRKVFGIKHF